MRVNLIGSIILTICLWIICSYFNLGLFPSLLLLLFSFLIFNYWGKIGWYWSALKDLFRKKEKKVKRNSPYYDLNLEE